MITYRRGLVHFFLRMVQRQGSVFPKSLCIALPCALFTALLNFSLQKDYSVVRFLRKPMLTDSSPWSGFIFLVGFLIVFRTGQAYSRFWEGCYSTHMMRAEWFDACSSVLAFCRASSASPSQTRVFQHLVVRLFSMLHAVSLAEIEDVAAHSTIDDIQAFKYELLDAQVIDAQSLQAIRESDTKVELVFQWIQQLIVENIATGIMSIPPPILSRSFQELATGMVHYHDAIKLSNIPFPFPYAQATEFLLVLHWIVTPFVVASWATEPAWAFIFTFITVFVMWGLNCIALEIENPFGSDANDIDAACMQAEFNKHLSLLLSPHTLRIPHINLEQRVTLNLGYSTNSFVEIWKAMTETGSSSPRSGASPIRPSIPPNSVAASFTAVLKRSATGQAPSHWRKVQSAETASRSLVKQFSGSSNSTSSAFSTARNEALEIPIDFDLMIKDLEHANLLVENPTRDVFSVPFDTNSTSERILASCSRCHRFSEEVGLVSDMRKPLSRALEPLAEGTASSGSLEGSSRAIKFGSTSL